MAIDLSKTLELYLKQPNEVYGDYYYIHLHEQNIGRMAGGARQTDNSIASIFGSYKRESARALKNQYIGYVKGSIKNQNGKKLSAGAKKILDDTLNINNNSVDKILTRLHDALKAGFESQFDDTNIIKALTAHADINWSLKNNTPAQQLNQIFQSNGAEGDPIEGFKFLDEILQTLELTCKLLNTKQGSDLAIILSQQIGNYTSTQELGINLQKALKKFIEENNGAKIKTEDIKDGLIAADLLNNLGETLEKNQTKSGAENNTYLSVRAFQSLFQNNIFPTLLELYANQLSEAAYTIPTTEIATFIANSARSSGTDKSYIQFTNPDGSIVDNAFLKNVGAREGKETRDAGKADSLVDVKLNGKMLTGKYHGSLTMSVGISSKNYVTNSIGEPLDKNYDKYSLGRGLNLGQAFSLIPNFSVYNRYLGYNVIARGEEQFPRGLIALQDILLTRGLAYLASGRGVEDSAQLLFLNGNIMSMWDVIQYAMENNIGKSGSLLGRRMSDDTNNGIYMSLKTRPDILRFARATNWYERLAKTNDAINSAVIQLEIVPKKILDYMSQKLTS